MKIFSNWLKYFNLYFFETLNFADYKYVFRFFTSFFGQKLQFSEVGPFCLFLPNFDHFKPTLEGCQNFWNRLQKLTFSQQIQQLFTLRRDFLTLTFYLTNYCRGRRGFSHPSQPANVSSITPHLNARVTFQKISLQF